MIIIIKLIIILLLDLPPYVADIQTRIEEKGSLVIASAEYSEVCFILIFLYFLND